MVGDQESQGQRSLGEAVVFDNERCIDGPGRPSHCIGRGDCRLSALLIIQKGGDAGGEEGGVPEAHEFRLW